MNIPLTILGKVEKDLSEAMKRKGELTEKLKNNETNESLKIEMDGCENKLKTLRLIKAELIKKNDKKEYTLSEDKEIKVLLGMKEERTKYIDVYNKANRKDLAETLVKENNIISEFVPAQPSDDEIKSFTIEVINKFKESQGDGYKPSIKDMGKVMPLVKAKYPLANGDMIKSILLG